MPAWIVNRKPMMEDLPGHDAEMRCEPCLPGVQRRERHAAIQVGGPVQVEEQFVSPGCGEYIVSTCAPILRALLQLGPRNRPRTSFARDQALAPAPAPFAPVAS
jgi:hypothetical protein